MKFPEIVSFTLTNACNLRCQMCGQWSKEGYISNKIKGPVVTPKMKPEDWIRLVDEMAGHPVKMVLVRGGEPFLYPRLMDILRHINSKGMFIALDTNGTIMEKYVEELVAIGNMHITFSVDGPEEIHDSVRGIKGSFRKTKESILLLNKLDKNGAINRNICFVISRYSYKGLGEMPFVAKSMGIREVNIVPCYYVTEKVGNIYEKELQENFAMTAFSWKGFHQEGSGIDMVEFSNQLEKYKANLDGVANGNYMPLGEEEYIKWFSDPLLPVGTVTCNNPEKLIDIQPDGDVNFCIDYPDYTFGNVRESTISELWNSDAAETFRNYRRKNPLAVCYRCGAKYVTADKS